MAYGSLLADKLRTKGHQHYRLIYYLCLLFLLFLRLNAATTYKTRPPSAKQIQITQDSLRSGTFISARYIARDLRHSSVFKLVTSSVSISVTPEIMRKIIAYYI
uniref:Uncharacterized protein n=1 Tax=Glossina pallidipes TaxID=7398 RepID=A0A1A9Z8S6_GLOPL